MSHQQSFSYKGMGLPGLNQYICTKLGLIFLLKDTTQWCSEAWTCGPSVSSQALYHWATVLPFGLMLFIFEYKISFGENIRNWCQKHRDQAGPEF